MLQDFLTEELVPDISNPEDPRVFLEQKGA